MTSTDFTDLIEQARQAADALQLEIDAAIDRHGVLRRFIDELLGDSDTPHTEVSTAVPVAAALTPKTAKATPSTSGTVPCPDCGKPRKPGNGLGVHRARAHKARPFTTEPITRGEFSEQAARDAVAGAPTGRVLPMHNGRPAGSAPAAPPATDARPAFTVEQAHEALA